MKIPWVRWYFSPIYISLRGGLLFLVGVFNKSMYSKDQSLLTIEFRRKYMYVRRTSLSVFGITLLEEVFVLPGTSDGLAFKNYNAENTECDIDLVEKVREAHRNTKFIQPKLKREKL